MSNKSQITADEMDIKDQLIRRRFQATSELIKYPSITSLGNYALYIRRLMYGYIY